MAGIGESIRKSIDDHLAGDTNFAMLHACNAIDGTAKKAYPSIGGSNLRFTTLLRDSYEILGPMGAPGFNMDTRWPVELAKPKAVGGTPDIADVIYGVHRCSHGHGEDLPDGFELLADASGPANVTRLNVEQGKVQLSDRMIFALLSVAVLAEENRDQKVPDGYFLTYSTTKIYINDWWGRKDDFLKLIEQDEMPSVEIDFSNWNNKSAI